MSDGPKREQWTEAQVLALPAGEHDYFDRKSGEVFDDTAKLKGTLAKAVSAFANSGGGHLVLGVDDDGAIDGVPPTHGNTPQRERLEQLIPPLVAHEISDFRVHEVIPDATSSEIPSGRVVLVVDVGDSALAPHQCAYGEGGAAKGVYYCRQGGHSVPAGHFYLELLRQRLTSPRLVVEVQPPELWFVAQKVKRNPRFVALRLRYRVLNEGQIAAVHWAIHRAWVVSLTEREGSYVFKRADFPETRSNPSSFPLDRSLLPGGFADESVEFGLYLFPHAGVVGPLPELQRLLKGVSFRYRVATETSLSDWVEVPVADSDAIAAIANAVIAEVGGLMNF